MSRGESDRNKNPGMKILQHAPGPGVTCTYKCEGDCRRTMLVASQGRIRYIGRSKWFTCLECLSKKAAANAV